MNEETVPFALANEIAKSVFFKNNKIDSKRILEEFDKVIGKDFVKLSKEVTDLNKKIEINKKMDKEFQDKPEEVTLLDYKEEELPVGTQKFSQSKEDLTELLKGQHKIINLFQKKSLNGDFEYKTPLEITNKEEKPSLREIEIYRDDYDPNVLDKTIQKAQSYIQKYKEYHKMIENIKDLSQIPSQVEKSLILENFQKCLNDARYYMKFSQQYSRYWSKEPTKYIVPYKGFFIPLEKRKKLYDFDQPIGEFDIFRQMIHEEFKNNGGIYNELNGKLPELAMYYSKSTFVPPMKKEELEKIYYPLRKVEEIHYKNKQIEIENSSEYPFIRMDSSIYLNRKHLLEKLKEPFCSSYDQTSERWNILNGEEFLNQIERLAFIFSNIKNMWIIHSLSQLILNQSSNSYNILIFVSILLGIPFVTLLGDTNPNQLQNFQLDQSLFTTFDDSLINNKYLKYLYYGPNEPNTLVYSRKGSKCLTDPVSNILQPTKEGVKESNNSLWEYVTFKVEGYKEILSSTKGVYNIPRLNVKRDSRIIYLSSNQLYSISNQDMEHVIYEYEKLILPCKSILFVSIGLNHPLYLPLLLLCLKNKISFYFISFISNLKEVPDVDLIISNHYIINLLKTKSIKKKVSRNFLESNIFHYFRKNFQKDIKLLEIESFNQNILYNYLFKCEFIIEKENIIETKTNELYKFLQNELDFYENIYQKIQNKQEMKEEYEKLLKELKLVTPNWDKLKSEEILKFLESRIELTKSSLELVELKVQENEKKELIFRILNEKFPLKDNKEIVITNIEKIIEKQGQINRFCLVKKGDHWYGITSKKLNEKEWEEISKRVKEIIKEIPFELPNYNFIKHIMNLDNFDIYDSMGEVIRNKLEKLIEIKSKL